MKVLEERLMYLIVHCGLQGSSLCTLSILAQGLSFVRLQFLFPSLPHLVLTYIQGSYRQVDLSVPPVSTTFASRDAPISGL